MRDVNSEENLTPGRTPTPVFGAPPVAEVALGVQFRTIYPLRGLEIAPLRDAWGEEYPKVEEQPALPVVVENDSLLNQPIQFSLGPLPPVRYWFLNLTGTELIQVQQDRVIVNWRQGDPPTEYPRYQYMRNLFARRAEELSEYVEGSGWGKLEINQADLTYINAIEPLNGEVGAVDEILRNWTPLAGHHLSAPEQMRAALVFRIPGAGRGTTRLHVSVDPAQRQDGQPILFLTMTVRGTPDGTGLDDALSFLDTGHDHLVRSFAELTAESMHSIWRRRI